MEAVRPTDGAVDPRVGRLLDGLDPAQRAAVCSEAAPLCIIAPAGSGKTRVLTRRIARRVLTGDADPGHVLALTFTRKAAAELGSRLSAIGVRDRVAAGTFNAVAYAQLRRRWADQGRQAWAVLDNPVRVVAAVLGPDGDPTVATAEIQWAKSRLVAPSSYAAAAVAAGRRPPFGPAGMAAVYERYEEEKHRRRVVDFDDLLAGCLRAIEADPGFAAAQRWRFRHLFVDEFQDVNPLQLRLLEAWRGGRPDLCVVGDPDQAIYGWNGADPRYLRDFATRWPGAEVLHLTANHRCTPQVLAAAAGVLHAAPPVATRPDGDPPTVTAHPTDREEAAAVAAAVRARHLPGHRWSEQAVLTRTRAQHELLAGALRAAGVPVRVRAGTRLLDHPAVRAVLADLRASGGSVTAAVTDVEVQAAEAGDGPDGDALRGLAALAGELAAVDPGAGGDGLLAWLATVGRGAEAPAVADAVEIATFHAAKGLEWPVVHLAGLEDGFVPVAWAGTPDAVAEERRLLHVAITRASAEVHCTWAERRVVGGADVERRRSPFVDDLLDAVAAVPAPPPLDWRGELAAGRARLRTGRTDPTTEQLLAALRAWRATAARAAAVEPAALLADRALEELARRRPRDLAELRAVPGVGPVRAVRHGAALLGLVAGTRALVS